MTLLGIDEGAREGVGAVEPVLGDHQIDRCAHRREDPLDRACRQLFGDQEITETARVGAFEFDDDGISETIDDVAQMAIGVGFEALAFPATLQPTIEITGLGQRDS